MSPSVAMTQKELNGITSSSSQDHVSDIAKAARAAFEASQLIDSSERVKALHAIHSELELQKTAVLEANRLDMEVFATRSIFFELAQC